MLKQKTQFRSEGFAHYNVCKRSAIHLIMLLSLAGVQQINLTAGRTGKTECSVADWHRLRHQHLASDALTMMSLSLGVVLIVDSVVASVFGYIFLVYSRNFHSVLAPVFRLATDNPAVMHLTCCCQAHFLQGQCYSFQEYHCS